MTDWRSEPPDADGWWLHRIHPALPPSCHLIEMHDGRPCLQGDYPALGWRHTLPVGGQWRKVPE